ncbi:DUF4238 domain-containing protein [Acinetobacter guillouiae]|uniref:DUF4238 domain-containing protein n=1 Tax=Acinetobacter guillouiae NIPH 991 TaxID=1217656 RepID=N8YBC8_ACIGI|nr:DUF4238 domain-containing protein [Acinetobacter guillouiae]ENV16948.1 hypothetical protein F964_02697 [Acinetobacter guillouiae NIPH 991]
MSDPKRHHFVHVSYQKRFLATETELYVLTNEYNKSLKLKTPSQICYEMHLHTVNLEGTKFLEIEKFYSSIEGQISKVLNFIDEGEKEHNSFWAEAIKIPNTQLILKFFISIMFWRNPCQAELAKKYSEKLLELYDAADNEARIIIADRKTIKYIQKNRNKHDLFKVIQFLLLPLITFKIWDKNVLVSIARVENHGVIVTCDNPVVFKTNVENLFNFQDFYIPLDKYSFLTSATFEEGFVRAVDVNLDIARNSKKYVMGASQEMMNYIKERF